ncbi:hypothetical protein [Pseudoduganella sp. OTU4001]|uniref:hypothetical protein n=1 Tax=Pseudoduganella sp. OTU4001 TaxID=3043854 RepID=UPI00313E9FE8
MPYQTPRWRIAFGIFISLLLHVAAVVWLRLPEPSVVADPRIWLTQVEVRIVPPPPPPIAPAQVEPETAPAPARVAAEPRRRQKERQRTAMVAVRPTKESTLILPPAGQGASKPFDREAAKAAARDIAAELDTGPVKYRETRDEKLARQIQNAARPNCKDGIPGGLLAPLYLMMDKKDSGCKW